MIDFNTFCKRCKPYQFALERGITCALTDAKPDFLGDCENFELDAEKDAALERQKNQDIAKRTMPSENLGFSWGAFGLTGLWLMFHGQIGMFFVLFILSLIPIIGQIAVFIMALNYGFSGRSIAWDYGNYESVQELKRKELGWDIAGGLVFILMVFVGIGYLAAI